MNPETLAIIDLGTNTFHLMLVEVDERENVVVKGKFKEMVKLGEGGINQGLIQEAAFQRGIMALKNFRKLIDSAGVVKVLAFATSAIRSAENGQVFIQEAQAQAQIRIKVINGNEEASLIHEGVRNGLQLPRDKTALLIDIGGGSVEFIVSERGQAMLLRSLNIGAARLLERFEPSDPITSDEVQALKDYLDQELASLVFELQEFDLGILVGSSGTCEALGALVAYLRGDDLSAENLNGYHFSKSHFDQIQDKLLSSTLAQRRKLPGMDPQRVELIIMGAVLYDYLLSKLDIGECLVSTFALKEGILYSYLREKQARIDRFMGSADRNVRAKAVQNLARKYDFDPGHGIKVSELATTLFKQLRSLTEYGEAELEILQYASVLHDIGRFIHPSGHHKHGQYIIMNSGLSGFSTNELVLLANLVRYHRRSHPKRDHFHYNLLPEERQRMVRILSGILRIADNLDRGHRHLVNGLKVEVDEQKIQIQVEATEDVSMEKGHAREHKRLLEEVLEKEVVIA